MNRREQRQHLNVLPGHFDQSAVDRCEESEVLEVAQAVGDKAQGGAVDHAAPPQAVVRDRADLLALDDGGPVEPALRRPDPDVDPQVAVGSSQRDDDAQGGCASR